MTELQHGLAKYKADNKINSIDMKNKEEYNNIIHQFITESNPKALSKRKKYSFSRPGTTRSSFSRWQNC